MSEIEQGKTITRIIFNHIAFEKHRAALTDKMGEYANRFNDDPTNNSAFLRVRSTNPKTCGLPVPVLSRT